MGLTFTRAMQSRTLCWNFALALCIVIGCAQDHSRDATTNSVSTAKSVMLLDLQDQPVDFRKLETTPATVVVFTRTDCPVSNRFAPEIRRLYELNHPRGVQFYLVYVDPRESVSAIQTHLKDYNYPCTALRDPKHSLVAYCHATITPEAVVFNQAREITYIGRISDLYVDLGNARPNATTHDLADAIESTLAGKPVATPRTKALGCFIEDLKE